MSTILVVDDRPTNRQFLLTLLGYTGHRVIDAADGAEALQVARAQRPDLIITDILMPTMDGYEFVLALRRDPDFAKTPVIFYSATYSTPEAELLAKSCGVDAVLRKPCEPQLILATVDQALGASAPKAGTSAVPTVAAGARRELEQVGSQTAAYLSDLRATGAMFDEIFVHGSDPAGVRERVRSVSAKFSGHVVDLQRFTSRLAMLIEIAMDTLSETDPARMVDKFFSTACRIVGSSCAAVGVLGETEPTLKLLFARGVDPAIFDRNPKSGISGRLLLRERSFILWQDGDDGPPLDGFPAGHPAVHSFLGGPIVFSDEVHGWIYFARQPGSEHFSAEDERIGATLATMLALLYEHVMLYDVIQRHAARLQIESAERKRAEQAAREGETKFRELIEQAADGIFVTDDHGNFLLANPRYCEMLGYDEAELRRLNVVVTYPEEQRASFPERMAQLKKVGRRLIERDMLRKDGIRFPAEVSMRLLTNGTHQGMVRDITERKEAAQALTESEQRFRQMAESIRDVFFLIDADSSRMHYVSPAYEETWGRSCESLYADPRSWAESIHPDDRAYSFEKWTEGVATGGFDYEYRIVRPDGAVRWIHARGFPIRDESGKIYRTAGVAEDITARKLAAEELRESDRRFSDMMGKVELVSLMLDQEARITHCNDYLLRLTGWKREEVLGRSWFELFIPPDIHDLKGVFADLIADLPRAWHHENEILTKSGARRLIRWNNSVLRSPSGEVIGTASIGEDITEQKQAEVRIRSLNRVYAVLSGINALIVRVRTRDELFQGACRIAVEDGRFVMAWIGLIDKDTNLIRPAASAGAVGNFFDHAPLAMGQNVESREGLAPRAVRERTPVFSNDIQNDSRSIMSEACRERGIQSVAFLPLLVGGEAPGVLGLYAREAGFFDDEEKKLLLELAGDISFALDHIEKEERVNYLAYYDQLTGLARGALFRERVGQYVHSADREQRKLAVTLIDVDRFKTINDTLGRNGGDEILKQTGKRLLRYCRDPGRLARINADRFAMVMPDVGTEQEVARRIEEALRGCFGESYRISDTELRIAAKVGVALFPNDGADAEALFRNAEAALKKAKSGGERYLFYTQQMTERIAEELALESKLRRALERQEFVLHYQPKFDAQTRRIEGVEALIRWQSPELGLVPPMQFIRRLEETGLIFEVGAWALRQAAFDHRRWRKLGLAAPRVAVNVSALQLRRRDFVESVRTVLGKGEGAAAIDLELTESLIMEDVRASTEKLEALRLLGVELAIDDFGTGYSSLTYLAKLPVQALKIDRSFIITMLKDPTIMTLVSTIISMAHSLKLKVVAEGVDSEDQVSALTKLGCDQLQGYLFSRPLPFEQVSALLGPRTGAGKRNRKAK